MKLALTTTLLAIIIGFISCNSNRSKAADYNNQLNNTIRKFQIPLIAIEKSVYTDFLNGDKEKVIADCKKAIDHIEKVRIKIKKITPPQIPRAKDLQTGCLNLMEWNQLFYEDFAEMAASETDTGSDSSFAELERCAENIRNAEIMLEELHADFAHQNGAQVSSY